MIWLLLLAAAPQAGVDLSSEVSAAIAARTTRGDEAFFSTIQALVDRDDASAMELLGEIYMMGGFGRESDPAKACKLFAKAAGRRGDSAHNLARCYELGNGFAADPVKARQWYRQAAEAGYAKSNCALGNLMVSGTGGPRDVPGGIALCRRAADAGVADAQTDLGNFLLAGTGGRRDMVEARKWYTLAAEQNQANAQFVLGQIYWKGDGTPVDRAAAVKWWKLSYAGGRKDAAGLIVGGLLKNMVIERDGQKTVDRSLVPETLTWLELNTKFSAEWPNITRKKDSPADADEHKGEEGKYDKYFSAEPGEGD